MKLATFSGHRWNSMNSMHVTQARIIWLGRPSCHLQLVVPPGRALLLQLGMHPCGGSLLHQRLLLRVQCLLLLPNVLNVHGRPGRCLLLLVLVPLTGCRFMRLSNDASVHKRGMLWPWRLPWKRAMPCYLAANNFCQMETCQMGT